jgi:hypothetical protein
MDFLGIDVGKSDLHAALLQGEQSSTKSVPNSATGIKQLIAWLKNRKMNDSTQGATRLWVRVSRLRTRRKTPGRFPPDVS